MGRRTERGEVNCRTPGLGRVCPGRIPQVGIAERSEARRIPEDCQPIVCHAGAVVARGAIRSALDKRRWRAIDALIELSSFARWWAGRAPAEDHDPTALIVLVE